MTFERCPQRTASMEYNRTWNMRPLFGHLEKHFQVALEPESHHAIDENFFKFKKKSLMSQCRKDNPIKWGFKFWF